MQQRLQCFDGPSLFAQESWTAPPITRPLLLFCYLATQEDWVSREELLALFWPEASEATARQNLRALLYSCKKETYGLALEVEQTRVRCIAETDVFIFREAVSHGKWRAAVESYRGTFLERFRGDDSAAFEAWLEGTRDELHVAWRDAALHVAADLSGQTRYSEAARLLQKVLNYDFLAEDVVQACIRAQALAGWQAQALATFETFRRHLAREIDMKPLETTLELADEVRRGKFIRQSPAPDVQAGASLVIPPTLPQPLTPFVGRTLELLELANLLADPRTRLITLLGPGGMGKSRLSLRVLEDHSARFGDGVAFVPLATLRSAADIPYATASALKLDLSGKGSVEQEIFEHLSDKYMLIVLDNFEHVLDGLPFVERLLGAAPRCIFVCTSRVLLGLPNEMVYDLSGLTLPASDHDNDLEAYDAAQLFVRSARRVRSDFSLQKRDYPALFELCKHLDGMPLALELAANWVRLFSLDDLAREVVCNTDLLEATGVQVSERHRSLRSLFEQSWQLLHPESQRVLTALSVFQGSFDRNAASAVTGASAKTLLSLVNASFLRVSPAGRFSMLLVIRQYVAEKLAELGDICSERHGVYYLEQLVAKADELSGPAPGPVLAQLEQDLENLRAAWRWACASGRVELCSSALRPLRLFLTARARLQEGVAFLEYALKLPQTAPDSSFVAGVQVELAYFSRRLDLQDKAQLHAQKALSIAQALGGAESLEIESLCELAIIGCWTGKFGDSARKAEQALDLAEKERNLGLAVKCKSRLALAWRYLGRFDDARQLYEVVLDFERRQGRQIDMLRTLSDLGRLYVDMNEPHRAKALFSEGLELAERHDMPYELGFMWEGLSQCSLLLGDFPLARQQAETALRCTEAVGDSMGVAVQCADLARILLALGELEPAEYYLRRALDIAWDRQETPEVMRLLVIWAALLIKLQDLDCAVQLLLSVAEHPGAQAVHKQEAQAWLRRLDAGGVTHSSDTLASLVNKLLKNT